MESDRTQISGGSRILALSHSQEEQVMCKINHTRSKLGGTYTNSFIFATGDIN